MLKDRRRKVHPLPEALRDRLREIPRRVVVCRDRDRLYAAALAAARDLPVEPAAAEHLASCGRCRALYGTLESAFAEPPRRPSPTLLGRLRNIARPPGLPAWIADGRYAAAACFLLTLILTSLAGDSAAVFRDASTGLGSRAAVWAEAGGSHGRRMWSGLSAALAAGYQNGRKTIEDSGASARALLEETVRDLGSLVQPEKPAREGDNDDQSQPESDPA